MNRGEGLHERANLLPALGFLTVLEHEQHGLFGGYLVLNGSGRPLEFHCTAPIKPNRAQQILYGPTLEPYLYGEQIGQALAAKAKQPVPVILVNVAPALALGDQIATPVVLVQPLSPIRLAEGSDTTTDDSSTGRRELPRTGKRLTQLRWEHHELTLPAGQIDAPWFAQLRETAHHLDLSEPFQRIRDAITEAHRTAA